MLVSVELNSLILELSGDGFIVFFQQLLATILSLEGLSTLWDSWVTVEDNTWSMN